MRKYTSVDMSNINYAFYIAKVVSDGLKLDYAEALNGIWGLSSI